MRITFVTNSLGVGGSEKMILFVANGLVNKGHEVSIINLNTNKDLTNANSETIKIINADIEYKNAIVTNYEQVKFVVKNAKALKSEILVGFLFIGNFCSSIAGKILRIPTIISERADPFHENANISGITKIKLTCINRADGAVFQTEGASQFYCESLRKKSCVIPNPISLPSGFLCKKIENKENTVVSLGRLDNMQKKVDVTLRAFEKFRKSHPDYRLLIYGKGPDEEKLKRLAVELKLDDSVIFKGVSKTPLKDLNEEKIFIITSEYEGISNTLLEAMALGLSVVSTDHSPGGARLLIQDKENGLLVPTNDVDGLANALSLYANDEALAIRCGKEARKVLQRFSPETIIIQWEKYIITIANTYYNE